jgi:hypothetical protein
VNFFSGCRPCPQQLKHRGFFRVCKHARGVIWFPFRITGQGLKERLRNCATGITAEFYYSDPQIEIMPTIADRD